MAAAVLLGGLASAQAGDASAGTVCRVEVLHSEALPGAPIFQNLVRARLRITPPGRPAFEATVEKFIPWQVPPPRRGRRLQMPCDAAAPDAFPFF
jgi:hypothetical protein